MRTFNKIVAAVAVATLMFGNSAAMAANKAITCYNTKTGVKKVVNAAKCPVGFSTKAPAKKAPVVKIEEGVTVSNVWVKALDTAMPKKIMAGDEVSFVLTFADGGQIKVTAPVKVSNAGSETYKPAMSM